MAESDVNRKLAAILSADVVGYGQLMQDDESATVATLIEYRAAIAGVVERHKGRVVNAPGDNILAEFPSAVEGVQAAVEIQKVLEGRNFELPTERRMEFRIGLNLGDVIEEDDGTIYGDGVNIAARMEALAETGGICISDTVYQSVETKLDFGFDFLGEQPVKNVAKPVRVYRVRAVSEIMQSSSAAERSRRRFPAFAFASIGTVVVIGLGIAAWLWQSPPVSDEQPFAETPAAVNPKLVEPVTPSVAVLPFANLSDHPGQDFFTDGISGDLITALSQYHELTVFARNSTFHYQDKDLSAAEIANELGARYVVEGDVRRQGDRVRVSAQLLDTETATSLWAESYDRELNDIFAVQDDITQQIIARMLPSLRQDIVNRARRKAPADITAYDLVQRALFAWDSDESPEFYTGAHELMEKALTIDPNYARAHALVANLYIVQVTQGWVEDREEAMNLALKHAERAVELDPGDAYGHRMMSRYYRFSGNSEMFEVEAYRSLALNPNDAETLADIATDLQTVFGMEKLVEGADMARRAMQLNPYHPGWYRWATMREAVFQERYEDSLADLNQMNMDDADIWKHVFTAMNYAGLGNEEATADAASRVLEVRPDYSFQWHMENTKMHPSYWDAYRRLIEKAGLPLGEPTH
jgi:adenylate cyclase